MTLPFTIVAIIDYFERKIISVDWVFHELLTCLWVESRAFTCVFGNALRKDTKQIPLRNICNYNDILEQIFQF